VKAKAKITIIVDCYDDHNEKTLEESHESIYVFDTWKLAQATDELSKSLIQDRQRIAFQWKAGFPSIHGDIQAHERIVASTFSV
jgi:hypothetical protein